MLHVLLGVLHLHDVQSALELETAGGMSEGRPRTRELLAVPLLHPSGAVLLLGQHGTHGEQNGAGQGVVWCGVVQVERAGNSCV